MNTKKIILLTCFLSSLFTYNINCMEIKGDMLVEKDNANTKATINGLSLLKVCKNANIANLKILLPFCTIGDLLTKDKSGKTPFNLVCSKNNKTAIKELFSYCLIFEKQDFQGKAFNSVEIDKSKTMTAKIFTEPDLTGMSPIEWARKNKYIVLEEDLKPFYNEK